MLFVVAVREALRCGLTRARDLIIDSAPILAWRRHDPDAASGHAPAHHPTTFLRGFRAHTLLCRGTGLPLFFVVAPANGHDAPFATLLLTWAGHLYRLRPRVVRMDAAYWGLTLIHWIHTTLGAVAVIPWNPKTRKTAVACRRPGPRPNSASAAASSASSGGSSASSASSAPRWSAGRRSCSASP
jgi:hypothetical protein